MKLFPYVLVRVSGGPFEELAALDLPQSSHLATEIHTRHEHLTCLTQRLSDTLYVSIATQTDATRRVALIHLRRDLFNERALSPETLSGVTPHLPDDVRADVDRYVQLREQLLDLRRAGEAVYAREVTAAKRQLRRLAQADNLQMGLLLSSQSLLKFGVARYVQGAPDEVRSEDWKIEQGLIKYLSRIYAKTSPFSTFTNLCIAKLAGDGSNAILNVSGGGQPVVVSHIRLNNYLYKYLKDLLLKNPQVYHRMRLRPNPTLQRTGEQYCYLTNHNNLEAFQRLPAQPALEVFQQLASGQREGVIYQDLVQTVVDEYIDAPAADIEAYLNQLIEYGFLEFNLGVSGLDPDWDLKLRRALDPFAAVHPAIDELRSTLEALRALAEQYGRSNVEGRKRALTAAYERFKAVCLKLHAAAGLPEEERKSLDELRAMRAERKRQPAETETTGPPAETPPEEHTEVFKHRANTRFRFRPEQMFYEDTSLDVMLELPAAQLAPVVDSLRHLFQELAVFEGHYTERAKMRHHFIQKYGRDASVSLLTFYEDYYREFKKPEVERRALARQQTPFDNGAPLQSPDTTVPEIEARWAYNHTWLAHFAAGVQAATPQIGDQIQLTLAQLQAVNQVAGQPAHPAKYAGSNSCFVQLFQHTTAGGRSHLMAVLNGFVTGYGRMLSRFLHLFDPCITEELRRWNQAHAHAALFIENGDASFSNANLHPPLMPFEIWTPGSHHSLPSQQHIAVTELQVSLAEGEDQLRLTHAPSQKRAYLFDLGFQGQGRSQLFQLLESFTPVQSISWLPLLNTVNQLAQPPDATPGQHVVVKPRLTYEDRIVLQRQTWIVPPAQLPFRKPHEGDWAYFARLNEWRLELKLPDEVFISIVDRSTLDNMPPEARRAFGHDDYKPQYVSFKNPFLVTLFEKLLHKVPVALRIEEMLPNAQQLPAIQQHKHVAEFILQWYATGEVRP